MKKLQSPNFHVSRTRLVIYNLPKSMNQKQLHKLLVDAVTSRATKQKPGIRQVSYSPLLYNSNIVLLSEPSFFVFYADQVLTK